MRLFFNLYKNNKMIYFKVKLGKLKIFISYGGRGRNIKIDII